MKVIRNFLAEHLPDFCFAVFAVAASIGAFTGGLWAALGIGFAMIAFLSVWLIDWRAPKPDIHFLYFVFVFLTLCALLNLHSWQPKLSWLKTEELLTIFLPLSFLSAPALQKRLYTPRLFSLLPWIAMISALALGIELGLQGPLLKLRHGPGVLLSQYNRGFSYLVILAFPLMAMLWRSKRRWIVLLFVLVLFFPASLTESRAAKLALVLGLATTLAAHFLPKLTPRLLAVTPFLAIGWPFAAQKIFLEHRDWVEHLPRSWEDRMEIWDYMSYRILDRPWLGWGLGSSPKLPFAEPHGALYQCELYGAPHPHNALIQLWVELGVPGLVAGILFAIWILWRINRLKPELTPFAFGAWVAAFCLSMIAYDFWSDSLWAAFALTGFAFALLEQKTAGRQS